MANPGKFDEAVSGIRWLLGKNPGGIPLDVSDDVAKASIGGAPRYTTDIDLPTGREPSLEGLGGIETPSVDGMVDWRGVRNAVESDGFPQNYVDNWPIHNAVSGEQARLSPSAQRRLDSARGTGPADFSGIDAGPLDDAPDFELGSPLWHQMDKGWKSHDNLRRNRTPNLRNQDPQLARIAGDDIRTRDAASRAVRSADAERAAGLREGLTDAATVAALVGGAAGLSSMYPSGDSPAQGDITDTSGTADLAAESGAPPSVTAVSSPDDPPDYSYQARQLIEKLNAMRRAAGGEVPEAESITEEVHRLLDMSNKQKSAPGYTPPMPTDYRGEAQRLLQKLNADRMDAGGEVPQTQSVMAEVRRLQELGDRMRNAG
jgi:hypothetical protein